ncbi:hypothetical protein E4U27_003841 [Claviceps purpurea]|nr:hypothetical protein E4U27_003841 [Claviceps purpurea]
MMRLHKWTRTEHRIAHEWDLDTDKVYTKHKSLQYTQTPPLPDWDTRFTDARAPSKMRRPINPYHGTHACGQPSDLWDRAEGEGTNLDGREEHMTRDLARDWLGSAVLIPYPDAIRYRTPG